MTDIVNKVYTINIVDGIVHDYDVGTEVVLSFDLQVPGVAPNGLPAGGTATQILVKQSAADYDVDWVDHAVVAVTSVFGRTGAVVAQAGDYTTDQVTEAANLYYTDARVAAQADVAANTAHRSATGNPHSTTAAQVGALAVAANLGDVGDQQTALNTLTAVAAATNEHVLTKDTGTGNAVWKAAAGGGGAVDSVFGRTGAVVAQANDYTWAQVDKTVSDLADITTRNHGDLAGAGTHTHAQIDAHIDSTANPHSVDATQVEYRDGESVYDTFDDTVPNGQLTAVVVSDGGGLAITWTAGKMRTPAAVSTSSGGATCTDDAKNYLVWDSGTTLTLQTSAPTDAQIEIACIHCQDGDIWAIHHEEQIGNTLDDMHHGISQTLPSLVRNGLEVSEDADATNPLDVQMSAGTWFRHFHDQIDVSQILSRNTPLVRWFHNGGVWDHDTDAEIDTSFWDNGTNKTAAVINRYYPSMFILGDGVLHWIYPRYQYFTETQALGGTMPDVPPGLEGFPRLTGYVYEGGEAALGTGARWIDLRVRIAEPVTVNAFGGIADNTTSLAADGIDTIRFIGSSPLTATVSTITGTKQVSYQINPTGTITIASLNVTSSLITPNVFSFSTLNFQNAMYCPFNGPIQLNTIAEYTADAGVTIDGLLIKDGGIPEAAVTAHEAAITHDNLSGAGTNTHAQIDTHLASTSNPHSVADTDVLPSMSGNAGKWLGTNGSASQWESVYEDIAIVLGDKSAVISTGAKAPIPVKDDMTIVGWSLLADQSGSIQVDVWNDSYANYPATVADSIVTPTITSAVKNQATGLTIDIDKGSHIIMNVDSVSTITECTVVLHCVRR